MKWPRIVLLRPDRTTVARCPRPLHDVEAHCWHWSEPVQSHHNYPFQWFTQQSCCACGHTVSVLTNEFPHGPYPPVVPPRIPPSMPRTPNPASYMGDRR